MEQQIQNLFIENPGKSFSINQIQQALNLKKDYSSVFRSVQKLIAKNIAEKEGRGKLTRYRLKTSDIEQYFEVPFFQRKPAKYNPDFLGRYIPNKSALLNKDDLKVLEKCNTKTSLNTDFISANKRLYENLLIDLAYSSSFLEGNTYSYLDTEVLIKYGQKAEGKTKEETIMILNHKKAIEYIIEHKNQIDFSAREIKNVHSMLGKDILFDEHLGVLRLKQVKIGGSTYEPPEQKMQLKGELAIFLKKLNAVKNPFEQCFLILVFLPYFQLFHDINKRTSRVFANVPLLKNNLIPFSFLTVNKKDYILGILSVYELNDIGKLKEVFLHSYQKTADRYF